MIANPKMPETPIVEVATVDIAATLTADHDRFSNSTFLMSMAQCTFKTPDGADGTIYISMGGNEIEVVLGQRSWRIGLAPLAEAACQADVKYLAKQKS